MWAAAEMYWKLFVLNLVVCNCCALKRLRSFALFFRLFALFHRLAFALICALLRAFACFCIRPRLERPRLGTAELNTKINANLVFQAYLSFLRFFRKENVGKCWQFPSRFAGVYLVFEVFQTKVAHFCFCLVRIEMPLLMYKIRQLWVKKGRNHVIQGVSEIGPKK